MPAKRPRALFGSAQRFTTTTRATYAPCCKMKQCLPPSIFILKTLFWQPLCFDMDRLIHPEVVVSSTRGCDPAKPASL
ncbi:hypothetical protein N7510_008831 [Penicillium lagena]|uniref:uncharacterized protein n=1 Tax=Penicillium lagena TaxID=94218 RepID=UPI002542434C|nr:uncharacterized protein N7510_008831 [Penicillium lagena]KAJ5606050.1 hypothetical protein N7510_008831 [Penicillium lagena]